MQVTNLKDLENPDFVALDKEGQVILVAGVKGFPFSFQDKQSKEYAMLRLIDYLKSAASLIPFAMLVDSENILIFKWNGHDLSEPILSFSSAEILNYYEPQFKEKQIFSLYLTTLTEAWLRDLAYHWKSEIPPALKEITEIGLSQILEDGTTQAY